MPLLFLATTLSVAVDTPTVNALFVEVSVRVDPVMRIGIWDVLPLAVATIVAVRVVGMLPAEKVTTALPVASLTTLDLLRIPLSAEKETVTPDTAALDASTTVAVTVDVVLLSDKTEADDAPRLTAAAVGTGVAGVTGVVELPDPPPPHALNSANIAIKQNDEMNRNEMIFNMCSRFTNWMTEQRRS